jgi:hypothetical protein
VELMTMGTDYAKLHMGRGMLNVDQRMTDFEGRLLGVEAGRSSSVALRTFTATEGQSVFVLVDTIDPEYVRVEVEGEEQDRDTNYTITLPSTITLSEGVPAGSEVKVWLYGSSVSPDGGLYVEQRFGRLETDLGDIATNVNDFNTLQDALASIGTQTKTLLIQKGITITANTTIPTNINLWFSPMGKITVNSGANLIINGGITAGLHQIFDGTGTVKGSPKIDRVYAEWFGAVTNNSSIDNTIYLDKAQRFCLNVKLAIGTYYLKTPLIPIYSASFEGTGRVSDIGAPVTQLKQLSDVPTIQLGYPMATIKNMCITGDVTKPNNHGIYFPSLGSYSVFERLLVTQCGGHGIYSGGISAHGIDLCHFHDLKLSNNKGYGLKLDMDIGNGFNTSKFELIECTQNELGGYYLDNCRQNVFERCHAFWNENPSGNTIYGYTIQGTKSVDATDFINCWSEQTSEHSYPDPTHKSGGFLINGGTNLRFVTPHTENEDRAFTINGGTNIEIINPSLGIQNYESCYHVYIGASVNQVVIKDYNLPSSPIVINLSSTSYVECTNQLPTTGRIPYNSSFRKGQRGKAFCTAQGSATQYQYNATLSANAGDNFLTWTTNNSLKIGDNILIPAAGTSGGGMFAQITDIDTVNKKVYINQSIVTSITNQVPATVLAVVYTEDFGGLAPTTGAYQRGDRVWLTTPSASGKIGWVCVTAGSPGTWKAFGVIDA